MSIADLIKNAKQHQDTDSSAAVPVTGAPRHKFRLPKKKTMFTGVDIGTTKICAVIGEIDPSGKVTILGCASAPSQGLQRGAVINLEETVDSIRLAVQKAEDMAQVTVRDVLVGIAGGHIQCHQLEAEVDVSNPERGITRNDVRRVVNRAIQHQVSVDREVLHQIPQRFLIDDGPVIEPIGFSSRKLKTEVLLVTAAVTSAQNIVRAVSQAGYRVAGIYLEPLASSLSVLTDHEKDLGVMLIDIGGGTTDVAIWAEGSVRFTGVVPFGGDYITEDISKGLRVSRYDAENLKKRYGHCIPGAVDAQERLPELTAIAGRTTDYNRQFLAEIIESRLEEMLCLVKEKVEKVPAFQSVYGGVVFTGGGSLQQGICDLGARIFEKPCKLGVPSGMTGLSSVVSSPIYATGVGLVLYGLEHERDAAYFEGNAFSRLVKRFKGLIDWYG